MIKTIAATYVLAMVVAVVICARLFPYTGGAEGTKNFGVVATIVVSAISGVMTAFVSLYTLHRNNEGQIALKRLEDDLITKREAFNSTKDAYQELLTAVTTSFGLLQKLQSGGWDAKNKIAMEKAFAKAMPHLMYVRNEEDQHVWLLVQQRSTFLAECAEESPDKAAQKELWNRRSQKLSDVVIQFQNIAKQTIQPNGATGAET